jgi:hypothetical protein
MRLVGFGLAVALAITLAIVVALAVRSGALG